VTVAVLSLATDARGEAEAEGRGEEEVLLRREVAGPSPAFADLLPSRGAWNSSLWL
jgi:hypothetical protein